MTRRARVLLIVSVLLAAQAAAFVAYRVIDSRDTSRSSAASSFDVERVDLDPPTPAPTIAVELAPGRERALTFTNEANRATLVHFWATWCVPCREELPALLDAADDDALGATVIAVSVDESWQVIDAFRADRHAAIARVDHEVAKAAYALGPLPVTFLVDGNGLVRARFRGAQPWSRTTDAAKLIASLLANNEHQRD